VHDRRIGDNFPNDFRVVELGGIEATQSEGVVRSGRNDVYLKSPAGALPYPRPISTVSESSAACEINITVASACVSTVPLNRSGVRLADDVDRAAIRVAA
jgi:hypothetical protein